ncbi:MAG: hypothetical protein K2N90_02185, partial [Lachnospiraceae bacterium]|nr:hypothetical protein [Lachnospiraceae bacterium]
EFIEGFTQGINAVEVSELMRDEEGNIIGHEQEDGFAGGQIPEPQPDTAAPAYDEIIAQAQAEIEEMKQQAVAEIEAMRAQSAEEGRNQGYEEGLEQGRKEGFAQGHQDGMNSVAEAREQALAEVTRKAERLEQEYQKKVKELEPKFIDTLTGIYEHIFHVSLRNSRELIVYLIQNTMRNIEGGNTYLIHVSKEDYPFASMQKRELIKNTNINIDDVELLEDATLSKNECMIETGSGVFDCSLGTQLEALNEELRLLSYEP